MNIVKTEIEGVLIIEPRLFRDARGIDIPQSWRKAQIADALADIFTKDTSYSKGKRFFNPDRCTI